MSAACQEIFIYGVHIMPTIGKIAAFDGIPVSAI